MPKFQIGDNVVIKGRAPRLGSSEKLYLNKELTIIDYWKGDPYGEYVVITDEGCNNRLFDYEIEYGNSNNNLMNRLIRILKEIYRKHGKY